VGWGRGVGHGDEAAAEARGDGACFVAFAVRDEGAAWDGTDSGASWMGGELTDGKGTAEADGMGAAEVAAAGVVSAGRGAAAAR
jgi:hypothetical protein